MAKNFNNKQSVPQTLTDKGLMKYQLPLALLEGRSWKASLVGIIGLTLILGAFVQIETALDTLEAGLKSVHNNTNAPRIQAINRQIESLHGKFSVLLTESVELKLKTLSSDMEQGKPKPEDARLFEELEKELQLLEQYSVDMEPGELEAGSLEHPRFKSTPVSQDATQGTELSTQITKLRSIMYLSLSALGIALVGFLGHWLKHPGAPLQISTSSEEGIKHLPKPPRE